MFKLFKVLNLFFFFFSWKLSSSLFIYSLLSSKMNLACLYHTLLNKLGSEWESLLPGKLNACKYANTQHTHEPTVMQSIQADRSTLHTPCLAALQTYPFLSGTSLSCPADRQSAITQDPISRTRLYWILWSSRLQLTLPGSNQHQQNRPSRLSEWASCACPPPAAGPALVMDLISTTTALVKTDPTRAGNILHRVGSLFDIMLMPIF